MIDRYISGKNGKISLGIVDLDYHRWMFLK